MAVLTSRHRRTGLGLLLAATVLLAELARLNGAVPPESDAPLAPETALSAGEGSLTDAATSPADAAISPDDAGSIETLDAQILAELALGPSLAAAPVPEDAYEPTMYTGTNGPAPAPGYGPLDVAQAYDINAALVDGVRDLDDFSASLRGLASQNGANVATVNLTAQKIKGLVGSVAAAVQALYPLIGSDVQTSDFPNYQDFLDALTILKNSMTLPGPDLDFPEFNTFLSLYSNYTQTTFTILMTFLQAPTSSSSWGDLGSNCQQYNPLDFLNYQTWTTDPSGTCPPTTFTIKNVVLDSSVCLFNIASVTGLGNAIAYQYSLYLNQYIAGFIFIAAVTAELAVVCQVTQIPTAYLPPITEEYQATYNVALKNLIGFATTMTMLFWASTPADRTSGLESIIYDSLTNTAINLETNSYSQPNVNYSANIQQSLSGAWPFMYWAVIVWDANSGQQFTQVGGCNPGNSNVGNQYAPGVGPNCTTLGGSFYTDFTTWNPPPESPIPSNLVYAIYFVPTSEPPQIGSLGNSLNTLVQNCYTANSNPTKLGGCISENDDGLRGVTVVSFGNGLRGYLVSEYFYFANVPSDSPDTTVVILPAAPQD